MWPCPGFLVEEVRRFYFLVGRGVAASGGVTMCSAEKRHAWGGIPESKEIRLWGDLFRGEVHPLKGGKKIVPPLAVT